MKLDLLNRFCNIITSDLFVSQLLATLSSLIVLIIWIKIEVNIYEPRREFKNLRAKVSSMLINEARYYSNPFPKDGNEELRTEYLVSSSAIRSLASDLDGFCCANKNFKYKGIDSINIENASAYLIKLSNMYFVSNENRILYDGVELDKKIRECLNL